MFKTLRLMNDKNTPVQFFFRNRKQFLVAALVGGILGVGVSFILPKKYLSTAIIYPVNTYSKDQIVTNPQFGYEIEAEQLMQLLESKSMRDRTIEEFDLYSYYELDKNDLRSKAKIDLLYINDISFFRSKYLSIVINVTTKSPELSAKIANFQVKEIDTYRASIFEANRVAELKVAEELLNDTKSDMLTLQDSIYTIKGGDEKLLFNFIENLNNDNYNAEDFVDAPALEPLINRYIFMNSEYKALNANFIKLKAAMEKKLPSVYVVDSAQPNYKSTSNSKLFSGFIGAFLSLFVVVVAKLWINKWNELKNQLSE